MSLAPVGESLTRGPPNENNGSNASGTEHARASGEWDFIMNPEGLPPGNTPGNTTISAIGSSGPSNNYQDPSTNAQGESNSRQHEEPEELQPKYSKQTIDSKQVVIERIQANTGINDISTLFEPEARPRFKTGNGRSVVFLGEIWQQFADKPVLVYPLILLKALEKLSKFMETAEDRGKAIEIVMRHRMERHRSGEQGYIVRGVVAADVDKAVEELSNPPVNEEAPSDHPRLTVKFRVPRTAVIPPAAETRNPSNKRTRGIQFSPHHYARASQVRRTPAPQSRTAPPNISSSRQTAPLNVPSSKRNATVDTVSDSEEEQSHGGHSNGERADRQGVNEGSDDGRGGDNGEGTDSDDTGGDGDRDGTPSSSDGESSVKVDDRGRRQMDELVDGAATMMVGELEGRSRITGNVPHRVLVSARRGFQAQYAMAVLDSELFKRADRRRKRQRRE